MLVDKAGGWTSHDVVARCRRIFAMRRIGHAGTLDPMATGLLVVALGRATRLLRFIQDAPKTYEAVAAFGVATDSLDADGAILSREEMIVDEAELRQVATRFVGTIAQIPPMVSAIRIEGRRLYELARSGVEVERAPRAVEIYDLEILDVSPGIYPEVAFRVTCGSGTYVRVLADDLARALGGRASLVSLRRTASARHRVEDASTIEDLEAAAAEGRLDARVMPPSSGLGHLPAFEVDEATAGAVRHGATFAAGPLAGLCGRYRLVDAAGTLVAVYQGDGRRSSAEVVMG